MKQVHQVPINRYGGRWAVLLRQQKSSTVWGHGAHVTHAMAERPAKIVWKCAAHSHTTCFSSVWLLSISLKCEGRQWALCDLAFPVSWSNHDSYWRFSTHQTQSAFSTHCINAHIGSPYIKEKHACVSFLHRETWLLRYCLQCSSHKTFWEENLSFSCSLCWGELVTLTFLFGSWLLLGNKWSSWLSKGSSCWFFHSFSGEEGWRYDYDFWFWSQDNLNNPCQ